MSDATLSNGFRPCVVATLSLGNLARAIDFNIYARDEPEGRMQKRLERWRRTAYFMPALPAIKSSTDLARATRYSSPLG